MKAGKKGNARRFMSLVLIFALILSLTPANEMTLSAYAQETDEGSGNEVSSGNADTMEAEEVSSGDADTVADSIDGEAVSSGDTVVITYIPEAGNLPDSDELFAGYVDRTFYNGNAISLFGSYGESRLSDSDLVIYQALKAEIAKVAEGSVSSAVFIVDTADLGIINDQNGISGMDHRLILDVLLVDCPYELYWYDKVTGVKLSYSISGGKVSKITFCFAVVEAYAGDGDYVTDTAKTRAASAAAGAAQSVIEKTSGLSDYEKLVEYKKYICEQVAYNTEAASDSYTGGYGDPWQLIYVFDGDASTNVVCEGYSKAFQYLCDMGGLTCYTVTGTMSGGTGAGGHMWNIVTLEGKNYLVDVTNSDTGSVGAYGGLFLAGTSETTINGYTIRIPSYDLGNGSHTVEASVVYIYDSDITTLYDETILKLAETDYVPVLSVSAAADRDTVTYGYSEAEAPVLTAAVKNAQGSYTCQWYEVFNGNTIARESNGEKFTVPVGLAAGKHEFYCTVISGSGTVNSNIVVITVEKAVPQVTVTQGSAVIYPGTDPAKVSLSYTVEGNIPGTLALVLESGRKFTVGTDTYNWKFTPEDVSDYTEVTGTVLLTVSKSVLTGLEASGIPEKTEYTYGDAFDVTGLTITAFYSDGSRLEVTDEVIASELKAGDTSVILSYTDAEGETAVCEISGITVNKKILDVEDTAEAWKKETEGTVYIYNGKAQGPSAPDALPDGVIIKAITGNSRTNAGDNYEAVITFGLAEGYSSDNYQLSSDSCTAVWSILRRTVTVVPDSLTKEYGAKDPVLTYTVPDTSLGLAEDHILTLFRTEGEKVGSYAVNAYVICTGNGADVTENYAVILTEAFFTITKPSLAAEDVIITLTEAGAEVTADSYIYDGNTKTPVVTIVKGGSVVDPGEYEITYANSNGGEGDHTSAGIVTVTVTAVDGGNYCGTASVEFEIAQAEPVCVPPVGLTVEYGEGLSTVKLTNAADNTPGTWAWKENEAWDSGDYIVTDAVGEHTYIAVFTPESTNYKKTEVSVIVTVTDTKAPVGTIAIGTGKWSSLPENMTFNGFFRDTETISITGRDNTDTPVDIAYFISKKGYSSEELQALEETVWTKYTGAIGLKAGKYVIYGRITDASGNTAYIGSDGIVIYTDSTISPEEIDYTYGEGCEKEIELTLNGNTIGRITEGERTLIPDKDYIISETRLILQTAYLDMLNAGTYTLTISCNPQGVETDEVELAAALTLRVEKAVITDVSGTVNSINAPEALAEIQTAVTGGKGYTASIAWDCDGSYDFHTAYTAVLTLIPDANYQFDSELTGTDGWTEERQNGVLTLTKTFPETRLERIEEIVSAFDNIKLEKHMANADAVTAILPGAVTVRLEENREVQLAVVWDCENYSTAPKAINTFTWVVPDSVTDGRYDRNQVVLAGAITVTNPDTLAVSILVNQENTTVTYDGSRIDLAGLFIIDPNAGDASYTVKGETGEGIQDGAFLNVTKAGTFIVTVDTAAQGIYGAGLQTAVLTVNKGNGLGSVAIEGWVYGDNASLPVFTSATNGTEGISCQYESTDGKGYAAKTAPEAAGSYKLTAVFAENDLYNSTAASAEFIIAPKALTDEMLILTWSDTVFDGSEKAPSVMVQDGEKTLLPDKDYRITQDSAVSAINAGKYRISVVGIGNYTGTASQIWVITGADMKVSAEDVSVTAYDGAAHRITVIGAPEDAVITYSLDGKNYTEENPACVNAGVYIVYYRVQASNYNEAGGSAAVTIGRLPITVTVNDQTKIYGDDDPELTFAVSRELPGNDILTGIVINREAGEDTGEYMITASQAADANPNYAVTFAAGKLTIEAKSIEDAAVELGDALIANGESQTQTIRRVLVKNNAGKELEAAYIVTGNQGSEPGIYTMTITGIGNFTGTITREFVIAPAADNGAETDPDEGNTSDNTSDNISDNTSDSISDNTSDQENTLDQENASNVSDKVFGTDSAEANISPKTEDSNDLWLWLAIIVIAGAIVAGTAICAGRKKEDLEQ